MQVHAVPDAERAFNSSGRRLPWAYEFADSDHTQRRIPEEKGPFGKARKRGTSRTKTPTNKSADEAAKQDNLRVVDDIFSRFKADEDKKRSLSGRVTSGASTALPPTASAPNLLDAGGLASSFSANVPTSSATKEPKEVILYGYGSDAQWAAIDFYEKVSNGIIYEEYDREPFNPKFGYSFSQQRASHYRSLSKSALRKVNEFVGGDHWIKVTFDSAEAAERACHYSPHPIQGYKVFAEPYRGTGPTVGDRAIRAEAGESVSQTASPNTMSSGTIIGPGVSQTSSTVSSATATGSAPASRPARKVSEPFFQPSGAFPQDLDVPVESAPVPLALHSMAADANSVQLRPQRATLRLKGANVKPAVFLPQEKAFLPAAPRWQQTLGSWPVIGWVIGSGHGIIGDQVPRKEDGSFDSKSASLYWRVWYTVDSCFGTDFCGVRDAEYDD